MKLKELQLLFRALHSVKNIKGNMEFIFAIPLNIKKILPHMEAIDAVVLSRTPYKEYDDAQKQCIESYAVEVNGSKIQANGSYTIHDDLVQAFQSAMNTVYETYPEARQAELKFTKDLEQLLEKEVEIDLVKIKKEDVPTGEHGCTPDQVQHLFPIITFE